MTCIIPVILFGFSLFSPPENSTVVVTNLLENQNLESIHLLLPDSTELVPVNIGVPIPPGVSGHVSFPWGYMYRVIFTTDLGNVYYQTGYLASSDPDTIRISMAKHEFGGIFDRVSGTRQIAVQNNSSLSIASIHVTGEVMPAGDILGSNPLMPGELLRLWVQGTEPYKLVFYDEDGFYSDTLVATANPDTVHRVTNDMFFHGGNVYSTDYTGYDITVANCISTEGLVLVEAYDEEGYQILFFELADTSLRTWDRLSTQVDYPIGFIICTDSKGREYHLNRPDPLSGIYIIDLHSLDFDFSFPEGQ